MVSGVKIPSVPAGREEDVRSDTTTTSPLGEIDGVERTSARMGPLSVATEVGAEATIGDRPANRAVAIYPSRITQERVANDHSETLIKWC